MAKKNFAKRMVSNVLISAARKYLQKDRDIRFMGMDLYVPVGVFHPSLFFSTKTMCLFLATLDIENKNILEIGCGSGAISIYAAKRNAKLVCSDINPLAVQTTQQNANINQVNIHLIESDLFTTVPQQKFDCILNNPPYYPQDPSNIEERAWFAGKELDYFKKFFHHSLGFLQPGGIVYMVLSDDCDLRIINRIAEENSFTGKMVYMRRHVLERSFIMKYTIQTP